MDKDLVVLFRQGRRVFPLEYWVLEVKMVFPLGYPEIEKKIIKSDEINTEQVQKLACSKNFTFFVQYSCNLVKIIRS